MRRLGVVLVAGIAFTVCFVACALLLAVTVLFEVCRGSRHPIDAAFARINSPFL